jgi:TusA-related sulfurtransferase
MNLITEIDVRNLACPEPFDKIMQALQTLPAGTSLRVLIHREPFPLYNVMRDAGYTWQTQVLAEDSFRILISRAA